MLGGTGTEHGWCDGHFNLTQRVRLPRSKKSKTIHTVGGACGEALCGALHQR